jgi:8-oxo-dGTP diphosphatase
VTRRPRPVAAHPAPRQPALGTPGRVLELGQTIEDGLRRETREETGLQIEPLALTGVYKNMPRGIIALVFRCKATGGSPAVGAEVAAFRWADEAQIVRLADEAYAIRIVDVLHPDKAPAVRAHDGVQLLAESRTQS